MATVSKPRIERTDPVGLVTLARRGRLRLPSFQRLYRWSAADVVRLFDSIVRGFPIGSLLLWERRAPAEQVRIGPLVVDSPADENALFVVDGQQRIISVVGALVAASDEPDPRFRIYYDLAAGEFVFSGQRKVVQEFWLPVAEMVENRRLLAWTRERLDLLSDTQVEAADTVASAVRDYDIPMYVVNADDEAVLRQVFDRMNFFGKRITQAEAFRALYPGQRDGGNGAGLDALASDLEPLGFGRFKGRDLYRSVLAVRGGDVFREFRDEFNDEKEVALAYESTRTALTDVVRFLQDEALVPHLRLLPYSLVIPVLTRYFALNGPAGERERTLLRRFVWRGAVAGTKFNSPTSSLRRAVNSVQDDGLASASRLLDLIPRLEGWAPDFGQISLKNAATRINILAMLSRPPRYLAVTHEEDGQEVGAPVDVQMLLDGGSSPLAVLTPERSFGSISARAFHPRMTTEQVAGLVSAGGVTEAVLESQWLNAELAELSAAGNWVDFLTVRTELMRPALIEYVARQAEFSARDGRGVAALLVDPMDDADA